MTVNRTPQRTLVTTFGVPVPGDGITAALFINNWVGKLQDNTYYLHEELKSVLTIDITLTSSYSGIVSRNVHLTAPGGTATKPTVTLTFTTPNTPIGAQRTVYVDRLSAGSVITFVGGSGTFHTFTARQQESGLTFVFVYDATDWVVYTQTVDNQEAPLVHDLEVDGSGNVTATGVRARIINIDTSSFSLGTASIQMAAAVGDPSGQKRLHALFTQQVSAGASISLKTSDTTTRFTYTPKREQKYLGIWFTLDDVNNIQVLGVTTDPTYSNVTSNFSALSDTTISNGKFIVKADTISGSAADITLPTGFNGAQFFIHVNTMTDGQVLTLLDPSFGVVSTITASGTAIKVTGKAVHTGGQWLNAGATAGSVTVT